MAYKIGSKLFIVTITLQYIMVDIVTIPYQYESPKKGQYFQVQTHLLAETIRLEQNLWIRHRTKPLAGSGLETEAKSLNGFRFSFRPNPQFKHLNSEPYRFCPNIILFFLLINPQLYFERVG